MNFLLSEELVDLKELLRKFFLQEYPVAQLRKQIGCAISANLSSEWQKFLDLGVLLAVVPEERGGLGFGSLASQVLLEEFGRALVPLPILEQVAYGIYPALLFGMGEKISDILHSVASTGVRVTGSLSLQAFQLETSIQVTLDPENKWILSGEQTFVPNAETADRLVVFAKKKEVDASETLSFFIVPLRASGVTIERQETFDLFQTFSRIQLKDVVVERLDVEGVSSNEFYASCLLLVGAELSGISAKVVEMTVEYVQTRQQFGRAIGSFQAIQHKLANMHMAAEQVMSLSRFASWAVQNSPEQSLGAALAVKALASEVVPALVEQAIQAHGGIGFTFEYELHWYLRRALILSSLLGDASESSRRLAELQFAEANEASSI